MERVRPYAHRIDTIWNGADETAIAQRMSLIAFMIRVASAGVIFLSQALIARWTGTFDYGVYVFVWTAMLIMGSFSCMGFQTAVVRFLPGYRKAGDLERLRGIIRTSRMFVFASATSVAIIGILAVWLLGDLIKSYYVLPFALAFICLPMLALEDVLEGTARANQWPVRALAPTFLVRPSLILFYVAAIHMLGYEASAEAAVIASVLATYTTTLLQLFFVNRGLAATYPKGPHRAEFSQWMTVAFPIFLVEGFFFLMTNADVLMVGFFRPPDEVGVYFATVKVLALVHFVFFAVKAGVSQQFAAYTEPGDRAALRVFARQTVGWTFWPSAAIGAAVLLLGEFLLSLFGAEFAEGYPLLFVLVAGVLFRASIGPAESLLNMTGYQNACAKIFAAVLVVNLALNIVLIPAYGLMGAAVANASATFLEAALLFFMTWRRIGVFMFVLAPHPKEEAA
jgi:O-antigen/teichoic acid export membrane protein